VNTPLSNDQEISKELTNFIYAHLPMDLWNEARKLVMQNQALREIEARIEEIKYLYDDQKIRGYIALNSDDANRRISELQSQKAKLEEK